MWGMTFLSGLNWLSSLSPVSWLLFLVVCWQSYVLFSVIVKLKNLKDLSTSSARKSESSDLNIVLGSKVRTIYPSVDIRKVTAIMVVTIAAAFMVARWADHQRGYCVPAGDISHSNDMTVLYQVAPQWWKVRSAVDGEEYNFKVCPTSPMVLGPGTYIEKAYYEYRNGCDDFTSPLASIKFK